MISKPLSNLRREALFNLALLAAVPHTPSWGFSTALVMIICNVLAIAFAKYTVKYPNVGPKLIDDFSVPALVGAACFGHVLGAGAILGLGNLGVL